MVNGVTVGNHCQDRGWVGGVGRTLSTPAERLVLENEGPEFDGFSKQQLPQSSTSRRASRTKVRVVRDLSPVTWPKGRKGLRYFDIASEGGEGYQVVFVRFAPRWVPVLSCPSR